MPGTAVSIDNKMVKKQNRYLLSVKLADQWEEADDK